MRRAGLIAMNLEEDDELIGARMAHADDDVLMVTANGQAIRFTVEELRSASRMSGGVRGIRLGKGDTLVSLNIAADDAQLLVVMENGYGKRTAIHEYPKHNRGGSGILTARLTDKTGKIAATRVISEHDSDLMIVSASGVMIRMDISVIRVLGRTTQGTLVQKLAEGDSIVAISTTNGKKPDGEEGEELAEGDELVAEDGTEVASSSEELTEEAQAAEAEE